MKVWSYKYLPLILLYRMLDKAGLIMPILFLVLVVPDVLGTYAFLASKHDINWFISAFAAIGVQFGGQFIEILNAFWTMIGRGPLVEKAVVFFGASFALLRFLWFFYIWDWINDKLEKTVSDATKLLWGVLILSLSTGIALVVDVYALPPGTQRFSGYTYIFANPEIVLDPLSHLAGQPPAEPSGALNTSVNNSTVGG